MQPALAPAPHMMPSSAPENAADQSLREHLLAQVHSPPSSHKLDILRVANPKSPRDQNIDPAIAGTGMMSRSAEESGGENDGLDGLDFKRPPKRELSSSKRAAQNRQAQRAFRQRKEEHIKHLQDRVKEFNLLNESYKAVQAENYQLRDYIISLQSRLIESQGEFPQPPSNIDLPHPRSTNAIPHIPAPTAPMGPSAVSQLQASAAQAVAADLVHNKRQQDDAAYLTGTLPNKKPKPSQSIEMRSTTDPQLAVSSAGSNGASVVA